MTRIERARASLPNNRPLADLQQQAKRAAKQQRDAAHILNVKRQQGLIR